MIELYREVSFDVSKIITKRYSTSFSSAVSFLEPEIRDAVYSIYGFVRLADEIVDTFHDFDKENLLNNFERDYYEALKYNISLNPALNAFQHTIVKYKIEDDLVQAFIKSMRTDLHKKNHLTQEETDEYIYGSAEVVGLMCLRVFVRGNDVLYQELKDPARKLGAAFQKVNFLRDLKTDMHNLERKYFSSTVINEFTESLKEELTSEISADFDAALPGIRKLPDNGRLGVLIAYFYYRSLLDKIKRTPAKLLIDKRIRVSDTIKLLILLKAKIVNKLNLF